MNCPFLQRFYILRHGETEANACGRIQGSTDLSSSLTECGRAQAASVGAVLHEEHKKNGVIIDKVYRSPLTRAGETLSIIRRHAPMVPQTETVHPDLTGINLYA